MGLQDQVRKFMQAQGKKLCMDLKQFATAPALFRVTGLDIQDPETGKLVTEKWVEFSTPNSPQALKDIIPAELDIDIDIVEAARRDLSVVRKQSMEFVSQVVMPLMPMINQQGMVFDAVEFVKDMAKNFETMSNPEKYFKEIPQQPMPVPGMPGIPGAPSEAITPGGIEDNANAVPSEGVPLGI